VAPQLQSFDEGPGQQTQDGPVELVQRSDVDGSKKVFGWLRHGFSSRLVASSLPVTAGPPSD
jgi:hypothetical protein